MEGERVYNAAVDFIDRNVAEGRGDKVAYCDPGRKLTYAQLHDAVTRVGPMLARLGLEPEHRIAMVMHDTLEFPILFWGAVRAGIIPVLLNTRLTAEQYRYLFADMRAKAIFAAASLLPVVRETANGLPSVKHIVSVGAGDEEALRFESLLAAETRGSPPAATSPDEIAYWLYSSGSTGMPKGVLHVHSSPRMMAERVSRQRFGVKQDDVIFSAPKAFFAYGIANTIFTSPWLGTTAVLYPERPTPEAVFEIFREHRPSVFFCVPTLYASILDDPSCTRRNGSDRLRLCVSAGEPLPAHLGEEWKKRFGVDIVNGVGSSETGHMYLTNLPGAVDYNVSGVAIEGFELKLVDALGERVAEGELGEMMVRSPTGAAGYWNQRDKSRRTFEGEWIRTGDKYSFAGGAYSFRGRADDMFKVSGIWVSPFEVEAALISHDRVLEAAVVPTEDAAGLIKPKAFVVLKDSREPSGQRDALRDELKAHVKATCGPWKYPRFIEFVDGLPKTATGKIRRFMLR